MVYDYKHEWNLLIYKPVFEERRENVSVKLDVLVKLSEGHVSDTNNTIGLLYTLKGSPNTSASDNLQVGTEKNQ